MGFVPKVPSEPHELCDFSGKPDEGESLLAAQFVGRERLFLVPSWTHWPYWALVLDEELLPKKIRSWLCGELLVKLSERGLHFDNLAHLLAPPITTDSTVVIGDLKIGSTPFLALSPHFQGLVVEPFAFEHPVTDFVPISRYDARCSVGLEGLRPG